MIKNVRLTPAQWEFLTSKEQYVGLSGGIGAGKSDILRYYLLKRVHEMHSQDLALLGAATESQLRDTVLTPLGNFLQDLGVQYDYNRNTKILKVAQARILCTSLENPNPLRGIEVGTIMVDEAAFVREEALDILLGRLRSKHAKRLEFRAVSSPNGFNRFYELFNGERKLPNSKLISARTKDNIWLPKSYIESLYKSYTPKQILQELEGQFINITSGAMYYPFDMDVHVTPRAVYNSEHPIYVGMDFNVGLHCSIICQVIDGKVRVIDEICLQDVGTVEASQAILDKYGHSKHPIVICPDATGARRQTSAQNSDHEILRRAGFLVHTDRSNPRVEDRVNTVNLAFQNDEIAINPTCGTLIRDLNLMTYSSKVKDPLLSHASDAFGYAMYKLKPLVAQQRRSSTIILD